MGDVFALGGREECGDLYAAELRDFPEFDSKFEGVRKRSSPIEVVMLITPPQRKLRPLGDIAHCWNLPFKFAFSERARELLQPVVRGSAEFLELILPDGAKMYGVHVLDYRDHALDEANSRIRRFGDGRISHLFPAFRASGLADATMFTLTHCRDVFVTEAISDLIEKAGLKGFSFIRYQPR